MRVDFKITKLLLFIPFLFLMNSCEEDKRALKDYIKATGSIAEMVVVINKEQWKGPVGDAVREVFEEEIPGLPQDEPRFKLITINPEDFTRVFTRHTNILFVTLLNDNTASGKKMKSFYTKESLEMMEKDQDLFLIVKQDEYAGGQQSMYVFAKDENSMVKHLKEYKEKLLNTLYAVEFKRIRENLYGLNEQTKLSEYIMNTHKINIRIPAGYEVAKDEEDFMWIRYMDKPIDKSILITYKPYTPGDFKLNKLIQWRDSMGYKYINDIEIEDSYMTTETEHFPVDTFKTKIQDKEVMEYRGLWKLKNNSRGGAFLG